MDDGVGEGRRESRSKLDYKLVKLGLARALPLVNSDLPFFMIIAKLQIEALLYCNRSYCKRCRIKDLRKKNFLICTYIYKLPRKYIVDL